MRDFITEIKPDSKQRFNRRHNTTKRRCSTKRTTKKGTKITKKGKKTGETTGNRRKTPERGRKGGVLLSFKKS